MPAGLENTDTGSDGDVEALDHAEHRDIEFGVGVCDCCGRETTVLIAEEESDFGVILEV